MYRVVLGTLLFFAFLSCKSTRPKYRGKEIVPNPNEQLAPPSDHHSPTKSEESIKLMVELMAAAEPQRCRESSPSGRAVLRQLTAQEYANTIQDILKLPGNYTGNLPTPIKSHGFANNLDLNTVKVDHASAYMENAQDIAQATLSQLPNLIACSTADGESCAQKVLTGLAPRLWRRPLSEEERSENLALYRSYVAQTPEAAMKAMLSSLLFSPHFIYRSELGKDGQLTSYELASSLSYFIWQSPPDDKLWELAANGSILENTVLQDEARRLLDDPRAKRLFDDFAEAWLAYRSVLAVGHPVEQFPLYTMENRQLLAKQVEDSFEFWIRNNYKLQDVFLAEKTPGDPKLSSYYQVPSRVENGVNILDFSAQKRRGALGFAAILASQASSVNAHPVKRGQFVMERIVCLEVEATPPNVDNKIGEGLDAQATNRERFAKHSQVPACAGCHAMIDGIGFGMEDYDALGLYRSMENNRPIDSKGALVGVDGGNRDFDGLDQLSGLLAKSAQTQRCFNLQWFRYQRGRLESRNDVCDIRQLSNQIINQDLSIKENLVQLISHASFRARKGP